MTDDGLNDEEFDRLVSGRPSAGHLNGNETAQFIRDLKELCLPSESDTRKGRHLAAIRTALSQRSRGLHLVHSAGAAAPMAASSRTLREALLQSMSGMAAKAAVLATALVTSAGGMAVAGVLPHPIQSAVSDAAGNVGITLPDPSAAPATAATGNVALPPTAPAARAGIPSVPAAPADPAETSQQLIEVADSARNLADESLSGAQQCVTGIQAELQALSSQVATLHPAQARSLADRAGELRRAAQDCAARAAETGEQSAAQAGEVVAQADRLGAVLGVPGQGEGALGAEAQSLVDSLLDLPSVASPAPAQSTGVQPQPSPAAAPVQEQDSSDGRGLGLVRSILGSLFGGAAQ